MPLTPHIGWTGYAGHDNASGVDLTGPMTLSRAAGQGRLLLAFAQTSTSSIPVDSITIDGVDMVLGISYFNSSPINRWTYIWYMLDPDLPTTAGNYTYYMTAATAGLGIAFVELYNVDQYAPINHFNSANNLSLDVNSIAGNLIVDMNWVWDIYSGALITTTPGAGQTLLINGYYSNWAGSQSYCLGVTSKVATGDPTTMSQSVDHGLEQGHVGVSVGARPQIFGPSVQNN